MGKTTITELSTTFGRALPFAKSLGVTLEDTGTMMAFLTSRGINTAESVTALAGMFRALESPAKQAKDAMERAGIEVRRFDDGTVDLISTMEQFQGMDADTFSKIIPEARAQLAIKSMADDVGGLADMVEGMRDRAGASASAFDIMAQTWNFKFSQLKMNIQGVMAEIGAIITEELLPYVDEANAILQRLLEIDYRKLASAFRGNMSLISKPLAETAKILGEMYVKSFMFALNNLITLVGPVFKSVGGAILAEMYSWMWWPRQYITFPLSLALEEAIMNLDTWINNFTMNFRIAFNSLPESVAIFRHTIVNSIKNMWVGIIEMSKNASSAIGSFLLDLPNRIVISFYSAITGLKNIFADLKAVTKTAIDSITLPFLYLRDVVYVTMRQIKAYMTRNFLTAVQTILPAIEKVEGVWNFIAEKVGLDTWNLQIDNTGIQEGIDEANAIINKGLFSSIESEWDATNSIYRDSVAKYWQEAEDTKLENEKQYLEKVQPYVDASNDIWAEHQETRLKNHEDALKKIEANAKKYEDATLPLNKSKIDKGFKELEKRVEQFNKNMQENAKQQAIGGGFLYPDLAEMADLGELPTITMPSIEGIDNLEDANEIFRNVYDQMKDTTSDFQGLKAVSFTNMVDADIAEFKKMYGVDEQSTGEYLEDMQNLAFNLFAVWDEATGQWVQVAAKNLEGVKDVMDEVAMEPLPLPSYDMREADWLDTFIFKLKELGNFSNGTGDKIKKGFIDVLDAIKPTAMKVGEVLQDVFKPFGRVFDELGDKLDKFFKGLDPEKMKNIKKGMEDAMTTISSMNNMFGAQSDYINSVIQENLDSLNERYDSDLEKQELRHQEELLAFQETSDYKNATNARQQQLLTELQQRQADEEKALLDQKAKDEEDVNKKFAKEKLRIWKGQQLAKIGEALMNTAKAVTEVMPNPFLMSAVSAMGAAQVAFIAKTKPPKYQMGGLIGGKPHSQGGTIIEAELGEYIINKQSAQRIGYNRLDSMNEMGSGGRVRPRMYANGGMVDANEPVKVVAEFNFTGNVLSKDFIEEEAIPIIRKALKKGVDIGL